MTLALERHYTLKPDESQPKANRCQLFLAGGLSEDDAVALAQLDTAEERLLEYHNRLAESWVKEVMVYESKFST